MYIFLLKLVWALPEKRLTCRFMAGTVPTLCICTVRPVKVDARATEMQVCEFVWKNPEFVFDTGEPNAKAKVEAETGGFRFEFGSDVQPQHISDAYETFIGMSNKRQMYLDRHHEKKKK